MLVLRLSLQVSVENQNWCQEYQVDDSQETAYLSDLKIQRNKAMGKTYLGSILVLIYSWFKYTVKLDIGTK